MAHANERATRRVSTLAGHFSAEGEQVETNPTAARKKTFTVAVLGAAGGIGQPLSLLLKQCQHVGTLNLYDIANVAGVAADLSHINSAAKVNGYTGPEQLGAALSGCDLVVIPAGIPRKPGMSRDDLFNINAGIVRDLCQAIAKHCPRALVNIISNPVNSTVPIAAEVFKAAGCYDPKRLMGVTTLDVMRARTFIAEVKGLDPLTLDVPVIGGHAGATILPLLSQVTPPVSFNQKELAHLTDRIQNGGTEVVNAKAGAGSATLSMAAAAATFAEACMRAMRGEPGIVECAYVASTLVQKCSFFATKVRLGTRGVEQVLGYGVLSPEEKASFEKMLPELQGSIAKGVTFVKHGGGASRGAASAGGSSKAKVAAAGAAPATQ